MAKEKEIINAEDVVGSEAAIMEESTDSGVYTHKFSRPFDYEGRTITELSFDFDSLTGRDSLAVEAELRASGLPVVLKSFDGGYLVRMCARACTDEGISHDVFDVMPVKDYNKITGVSRRFF